MVMKKNLFVFGALVCLSFSVTALAHADGEATYNKVCSACHGTGAAGAPKIGDKQAWAARIKEGQSELTAHAYVGLGAMPPKGGKPDLSVEDFADAVVYMVNKVGANWKSPDAKGLAQINVEIAKRKRELASKAAKK